MDRVEKFVSDFLAHYASQYYDPAKAREYYLKTRELKGRRSAADLKTTDKKQAWAYADHKIGEARTAALKDAAEKNKQFLDKARKDATDKRKHWSDMLKSILGTAGIAGERKQWTDEHRAKTKAALDHASELAKAEVARIAADSADKMAKVQADIRKVSEDAQKKIDALPQIPDGVSKERRAQLTAQRSEEIAKIKGDAETARTDLGAQAAQIQTESATAKKKISDWAANERKSISANSADEQTKFNEKIKVATQEERDGVAKKREEVGTQLKSTVEKARSDYEVLKQNLKAKYEQASNVEYEAIRQKV